MSTRTIASPGVQINEVDLSLIARPIGATNTFITGFANQGPTDELINVGSLSEYEEVFGTPTNAAERYLYHSARQLLTQSPTNLLVTRMPYGSGAGAGFSNQYTALVCPLSSNASTYENSTEFKLLAPKSILLSDQQYLDIVENNVTWGKSCTQEVDIENFGDLQNYGGIVVINSAKTSVNNLYEGYYIAIADNSNHNPATDFTCITSVKAGNTIVDGNYQTFVTIKRTRRRVIISFNFN